ncbi:hypothetical protein EXIGLDRAFT_99573 [Exidia glandulosa HHB12029]|uniref:Uncharacterized protein n=1 Tax=Exidia glandulosa HHB12029 TaxID=1314781 RepID=A0A165NQJ8_EXIGL|nr:hypothetical protein EXIGLDRAFT_99573 [Exidia glandulosa HHB12029]
MLRYAPGLDITLARRTRVDEGGPNQSGAAVARGAAISRCVGTLHGERDSIRIHKRS